METPQQLASGSAAALAAALSSYPLSPAGASFTSLPSTTGPLEDVVVAVSSTLRLALYLLSWAYSAAFTLASFATLTTPRIVYSILSWSVLFSLRLDITKVVALILVGATILSYIWKVRFLNRYTTLKEIPLVKDEGFDL